MVEDGYVAKAEAQLTKADKQKRSVALIYKSLSLRP